MNLAVALKIFTLGVRLGVRHKSLGLDIDKSSNDYLEKFLAESFKAHIGEIQEHAKALDLERTQAQWYAQHWTAKQSFEFGLQTGFDEWPKTPPDKKGVKVLTHELMDKLTQLQFRACKEFGEE